jgi:sensor histidine kinase YesM
MSKITFFKGGFNINLLDRYSPIKLILISLISAIFIIYPNLAFFSYEHNYLGPAKHTAHILFFIFRYLFFSALIWILLRHNLLKIKTSSFRKRLIQTFIITVIADLIYIGFSIPLSPKPEWISGLLVFQFLVVFIFCALIGHVAYLYSEQRRREQEIEQLRIENLQSRYVALTNQINPHFFFNSLNGLTSLIRKKNEENALEYVNKMSDVFRYVLQSDKKGLVTLGEELEFVKAFFYMLEIRFANKLVFNIDVADDKRDLKLPVLSLLPLLDNAVVHNMIDSEHKMEIVICLNPQMELSVSNPIFPKMTSPDTNGTGLKNLENRFLLLLNQQIRIKNDGVRFTVYLPLKEDKNENTDS